MEELDFNEYCKLSDDCTPISYQKFQKECENYILKKGALTQYYNIKLEFCKSKKEICYQCEFEVGEDWYLITYRQYDNKYKWLVIQLTSDNEVYRGVATTLSDAFMKVLKMVIERNKVDGK